MRAEYQVPSLAGFEDELDSFAFAHDGLRGLGQTALRTKQVEAAKQAALLKMQSQAAALSAQAAADAKSGIVNPPADPVARAAYMAAWQSANGVVSSGEIVDEAAISARATADAKGGVYLPPVADKMPQSRRLYDYVWEQVAGRPPPGAGSSLSPAIVVGALAAVVAAVILFKK